jgi:DNA/RNA endonuclease YhcR with UshA esterase domain
MTAPPEARAERDWRYEELELVIFSAGLDRFKVFVTLAPCGRGAQHSELVCTRAELEALVVQAEKAVRRGDRARPSPREVGERLFEMLFAGRVRTAYLQSRTYAENQAYTGLRIRIQVDPADPDLPEIGALPWELLYRAESHEHLALDERTPVVRYLPVPGRSAATPLPAVLRVLVVGAQPRGLPQLDFQREVQALTSALQAVPAVEVDILDHATPQSLLLKLMSSTFHVLHFIGHGQFNPASGRGSLLFEDGQGEVADLDARKLGNMLKSSSPRLVFLNACDTAHLPRHRGQDPFAGVASALLMAGIPAVLAMQFPISDRAALAFSEWFYQALASGRPIDAAVVQGRLGIDLDPSQSAEWAIPALFMSVPDGRIFKPAGFPSFRLPRPRRLLAGVLVAAMALGVWAFHRGARSDRGTAAEPRIEAAEARQHLNQSARVCGYVAAARYVESSTGQPTFLDFEKEFPEQVFTVVIWREGRARFAEAPETKYVRTRICATGKIDSYNGIPRIEVRDPSQLTPDRDSMDRMQREAAQTDSKLAFKPSGRQAEETAMRRAFSSYVAAPILLTLLTAAVLAPPAAVAAAPDKIAAAEAAQHADQQATVCGLVAGAKYADRSRGKPTFLDFEKPHPGEVFKVVIWGSDRAKFKTPPETAYNQKRVCVTGFIKLYRGAPEIVVRDPAQLALDNGAGR